MSGTKSIDLNKIIRDAEKATDLRSRGTRTSDELWVEYFSLVQRLGDPDTIIALCKVAEAANKFIAATYPDMSMIQEYTKLVSAIKPFTTDASDNEQEAGDE